MTRVSVISGGASRGEAVFRHLAESIPLGRLGTGDDIAAACAFLCSEAAGLITGQVLSVNGGSIIS